MIERCSFGRSSKAASLLRQGQAAIDASYGDVVELHSAPELGVALQRINATLKSLAVTSYHTDDDARGTGSTFHVDGRQSYRKLHVDDPTEQETLEYQDWGTRK